MEISDLDVARKLIAMSQGAKDRNIKFNLSFNKLKQLMHAKRCYWTGNPITESNLSIDRIDPDKGYSDDNVVATTIEFNGKRKNLTPSEILIMASKLRKMGYSLKK